MLCLLCYNFVVASQLSKVGTSNGSVFGGVNERILEGNMGGKPTFKDLISDPWHRNIINTLESAYVSPLPENIQTILIDATYWADVIPKQGYNWVKNTLLLASKIIDNTAVDMFWIKLYALLAEPGPYFSKGEELIGEFKNKPETVTKRAFFDSIELSHTISKVKDTFSESELMAITYLRHCRCHVHQNAYRVRLSPKNIEVIKDFKEPLVGKKISIDDFLTEISKIFDQISPMERVDQGLENVLAIRFCEKISSQLRNVKRALNNFEKTNFIQM